MPEAFPHSVRVVRASVSATNREVLQDERRISESGSLLKQRVVAFLSSPRSTCVIGRGRSGAGGADRVYDVEPESARWFWSRRPLLPAKPEVCAAAAAARNRLAPCTPAESGGTGARRLITRRSQVQILPPLLKKALQSRAFCLLESRRETELCTPFCTHRNSARSRFEWNRRVPCCQDGRWRRRSVLVGCTNSVVGRNPRDLQRNRICAPHNNRRRPGRLDRGTTAHQPRLTSVVRTASSSRAWRFSGGQRKSSSGWAAESSVPSRPFRLAPERTRRPRSPNRPLLTLAACRSFHDEVSPWKHQTGRSKPGERGNTSTTRRPRVGFSLSASRAVRSLATSPSERSALGGDKTDRSAHLRQR
jgi:hypothetical protein